MRGMGLLNRGESCDGVQGNGPQSLQRGAVAGGAVPLIAMECVVRKVAAEMLA